MDELTEALDYFDGREAQTPDEAEKLQRIFDAARAYSEGRQVLWCEKHEASATGQTDRCLSALNAALRLGVNPFDPYNSRKFGGKCQLVNAVVAVAERRRT